MTKYEIQKSIDQLEWLIYAVTQNKECQKNTFEYAFKIYTENAIEILKEYKKEIKE